ncbi:MAG TPA: hypothetical protein VH638_07225, partial [Gemmatimonadaceae bacterium]
MTTIATPVEPVAPPTAATPAAPVATRTSYREAIRQALRAAMLADERVFLMGEDVGRYGGCYAVSKGML